MSGHPAWFLLLIAVLLWYGILTLYVGWRGLREVRALMSALRKQPGQPGTPPSAPREGT
jgi:hypothetical protein